MRFNDYVRLLEEEIKKRILFGFTIRVGDLVDGAFNPNLQLQVQGDSTAEFMANLERQLKENRIPPLSSETKRKMWEKLSDLELEFFKKQKELEKIAM